MYQSRAVIVEPNVRPSTSMNNCQIGKPVEPDDDRCCIMASDSEDIYVEGAVLVVSCRYNK